MNITQATKEEFDFVENELVEFSDKAKPFTQQPSEVSFKYVAKDGDKLIGGIFGYASGYKIGYVDTLWVAEEYRRQDVGTQLMQKMEQALREFGSDLVHLETFDYQGPKFYEAIGYEKFGELYYPSADVTEIYYSKKL